MHDWLAALGLSALKPWLQQLVLPPLPLLLLGVLGWVLLARGRRGRLGLACVGLSLAGLWLLATPAVASLLMQGLLQPPPPLTTTQVDALRGAPHTAILVLGAGRRALVLETGESSLSPLTLERLQHGVWLARRTGLPLGYSGGVGHGSLPGTSEAATAQRTAQQLYGLSLRWAEGRSRDTRENAALSVPQLRADGVQRIVLVTHAFHQRRALAAFERAVREGGGGLEIVPAPVGVLPRRPLEAADWLPNEDGFTLTRIVMHEWIGRLAGA